ncbi:acyl-CoA-binding protein [Salinisphaera orenii MK-B5]|uniref:Acyl-CoA-binding protein n=2 Tax=Salinisphaera orenii TaxID=856731 RepID=A0A423PT09_9GAMM|nr:MULTISPECIES: acyl-CoA-binding protein [Salinisphaera]ROO25888.1 acyl-CoA-binding protein [Salinisphaera halophila YIM 95161]ROO28692.1 acyl-CoA-binding protein [Salinisphaera orenii MK-B5]
MADLKADFEQAQEDVQKLSSRPSNDDLLALYAHYKQATVGDVEGKRPGFTDLKGRAKYDAWAKLAGTKADTAMRGYIEKVNSLLDADS